MEHLTNMLYAIRTRSTFGLANDANVQGPGSVGAKWLDTVRREALDIIEHAIEPEGVRLVGDEAVDALRYLLDEGTTSHEVADSNVPIHDRHRMQVLVDLAAEREDLSEYYGETEGLVSIVSLAGTALYVVAERLVATLFTDALHAAQADARVEATR